jgi:hypothetical protein
MQSNDGIVVDLAIIAILFYISGVVISARADQ